jgi:uncharacterized protein involved in copper resistance
MAKTGLLQVVCTAAILAAAPAFAQTNMPTGDTAAGGTSNNPTAHEAMPNSTMAPAEKMGTGMGSHAAMDHHSRGMGMSHAMRDRSGDMASDQLNEQSYQAARNGQAFNAMPSSTGSGAMTTPGGPPSMNDMHGGSMSGKGQIGGDGNGGGGGGNGM